MGDELVLRGLATAHLLQEDSAGGAVCPLTVPDARRLLVVPVWTTPSPAC